MTALTIVKILGILVSEVVLIYSNINELFYIWKTRYQQKYQQYVIIVRKFGAYIHEVSNFLSIGTYSNGVMAIVKLCHLWHKWQRHMWIYEYLCKQTQNTIYIFTK